MFYILFERVNRTSYGFISFLSSKCWSWSFINYYFSPFFYSYILINQINKKFICKQSYLIRIRHLLYFVIVAVFFMNILKFTCILLIFQRFIQIQIYNSINETFHQLIFLIEIFWGADASYSLIFYYQFYVKERFNW